MKIEKLGKLAFAVGLTRQRNVTVTAVADHQLDLDGQIADVEKKDGTLVIAPSESPENT